MSIRVHKRVTQRWIVALMQILMITSLTGQSLAQELASVNGQPVSSQRYHQHYQQLLRSHPNALGNNRLEKSLAQRVLLPLVKELLIRDEAQRLNVDLSKLTYADPMIALRKSYSTKTRRDEYLRRIGETEETLRTKRWLHEATRMLMENQGILRVTDDEVRAEYQRQLPRLKQPERIRARQILFQLSAESSAEQATQAHDQAQKVHLKLLNKEVTFEVGVWRYSQGPLRLKKGDLGFVSRGELVQVVEDMIWSLKEGEISTPIRSRYGWHILLRGKRVAPTQRTFDEVKVGLQDGLKRKRFHQGSRGYIRKLWQKSNVNSSVPLRY